MFVQGICKKCKGTAIFDIEELTDAAVLRLLSVADFGHCKAGGFHVEVGKMLDYYILDLTDKRETAEEFHSQVNKSNTP